MNTDQPLTQRLVLPVALIAKPRGLIPSSSPSGWRPACLLRETHVDKVHELSWAGCWIQPNGKLPSSRVSLQLSLARSWPSVLTKLTTTCQIPLLLVETLPLCLFINR